MYQQSCTETAQYVHSWVTTNAVRPNAVDFALAARVFLGLTSSASRRDWCRQFDATLILRTVSVDVLQTTMCYCSVTCAWLVFNWRIFCNWKQTSAIKPPFSSRYESRSNINIDIKTIELGASYILSLLTWKLLVFWDCIYFSLNLKPFEILIQSIIETEFVESDVRWNVISTFWFKGFQS